MKKQETERDYSYFMVTPDDHGTAAVTILARIDGGRDPLYEVLGKAAAYYAGDPDFVKTDSEFIDYVRDYAKSDHNSGIKDIDDDDEILRYAESVFQEWICIEPAPSCDCSYDEWYDSNCDPVYLRCDRVETCSVEDVEEAIEYHKEHGEWPYVPCSYQPTTAAYFAMVIPNR